MANPTVAQVPEAAAAQQQPRATFNFKAILQQMVQLNASDLHLKVGRPPTLRVNGDLSPLPLSAGRLTPAPQTFLPPASCATESARPLEEARASALV